MWLEASECRKATTRTISDGWPMRRISSLRRSIVGRMIDKAIEELRALVRSDRRARKGPFSTELRERLNAVLKRRWQAGESH